MQSMNARGPDRHAGRARQTGQPGQARRPDPDLDPDEDPDDDERDSLIDVPGGVRLQKVLAAAGVGSRRYCEELIGEGRVEVDGETVRRYGARVDPQHQVIRVDGMRIPSRQDLVYLALNKPAGVLTPRDVGRRLLTGVELEDGVATADKFRVVEQAASRALVELTLHEGRKHIVRRMLAEVGHPVSRLVRTHVGPIALGSQRPGTTRPLTTREIGELYAAVGL